MPLRFPWRNRLAHIVLPRLEAEQVEVSCIIVRTFDMSGIFLQLLLHHHIS